MADTKPYGDVDYADPGYQADKVKRYPLDSEEHVRAAWSYINMAKNAAQYSSEQVASIKGKIKAAAKKYGIEIADEQQQASDLQPLTGLCVRAMAEAPTFELKNDRRTLAGYLAVFDQWAEVNSRLEGRFMERMSRGAFNKTLRNNREGLRVLFNHGEDPQVGFKPLGTISNLEEDSRGVAYEVDLFDVDYVRSLLPALEAGQFGSSFTFRPVKDKRQVTHHPQRSDFNPEGIPEVTVQELNMREFGPCMFPVYAGTSAGLRSMTDEFVFAHLASDPDRLRQLLTSVDPTPIVAAATNALSTEPSRGNPLANGQSRNVQPTVPVRKRFETREGYLEWLSNSRT